MLLLLTIFLSYIGSLPFGMINLNVLYAGLTRSQNAAILMASGAAIIELIQGVVAAFIYVNLVHFTAFEYYFKWAAIAVFIILALYYLFKPKNKVVDFSAVEKNTNSLPFIQGVLLSLFNFMAIPFWLIILSMISNYLVFDWQNIHLIVFGLGAGCGGFLASITYLIIGRKFISRSSAIYQYLEYGLAVLFLALAIVTLIFK